MNRRLPADAFRENEILRKTPAYREYAELCYDLFSKDYDGYGNLIDEDDANKTNGGNDDTEEEN